MKKILIPSLVIALFVASVLLIKNKRKNEHVFISGNIENATLDTVEIGSYSAKIDDKDHFELNIELKRARYFNFRYGKEVSLFLTPGDSLFITMRT